MNELKQLLLDAQEDQIDAGARQSIATWSEPPKALEIFRTLDECVYGAMTSGFVVQVLETMLVVQSKEENLTRAQLEELAIWREKLR